MAPQEQITLLNDLLSKCYDAEKGYQEAADQVDNIHLKEIFNNLAKQRYDFGHQLKAQIKVLGGTIEKGDTLAAKAHRVWMDLKSTLSTNEEAAILEEIKRGEEYALSSYQNALDKLPNPSPTYDMVNRQYNAVSASIHKVGMLDTTFSA